MRIRLVAVALALGTVAHAQPPVRKDVGGERTTRGGVYTAAQAKRGGDVYLGLCKSCHTPASHTGVTFANWWEGHPLSDLYEFVNTRMPKNDPGGLTPEQTADVVAYLLRLNVMPAGAAELPADADALKNVRIAVTKPAAKPAPKPVTRPKPKPR